MKVKSKFPIEYQWNPRQKQFCKPKNSEKIPCGNFIYYNSTKDFLKNVVTSGVPPLYIYVALDPNSTWGCQVLRQRLEDRYEVTKGKPQLTHEELSVVINLLMQRGDEFGVRFQKFERNCMKIVDQEKLKEMVHHKIIVVIDLLMEYFFFGNMGLRHIRSTIRQLLNWAADPWMESTQSVLLRQFADKLFQDCQDKKWSICRDIYQDMNTAGFDAPHHQAISNYALQIWPMTAYGVVYLKTVLAGTVNMLQAKVSQKKARKSGQMKITDFQVNEEATKEAELEPIETLEDINDEINKAVNYIANELDRLIRFWNRSSKFSEDEEFMWLNLISQSLTFYVVTACSDEVISRLELEYEKATKRRKKKVGDSNMDSILLKLMNTAKQIDCAKNTSTQLSMENLSLEEPTYLF
ncbi:hypothetical protein L596_019537 [Steinernema carpocapsae]|uniref:Uncharacterized protein n=1 Tax=Steinernema carpocapsae TaxID=34508 RepID=A0A4U5MQX5_STECR|nr:hypothetical protein L596_019537 [Steinernema carpocapsae]